MSPSSLLRIAIGPQLPGAGSWEWLGEDLAAELRQEFDIAIFRDEIPACDVVVFIKYKPSADVLGDLQKRAAIVFCPVDGYGSAEEIDADESLLLCDRIAVHAPNLAKYFRSYAKTLCLDHPLKFTIPLREKFLAGGPVLWVGVRSNLPPVAKWLSTARPPEEIWILTNPERPDDVNSPERMGLPSGLNLRLGAWTAERHREWLSQARAAIDVKGEDFRARHKPAAKALDYLASGVPLAMNAESSPVKHLRSLGFEIAVPEDRERWLSEAYWKETVEFGKTLPLRLSRSEIGKQWAKLLHEVVNERASRQTFFEISGVPDSPDPARRESTAPYCAVVPRSTRVAIVSLLFNWPSTGGGTVHTYETAKFLAQAGYEVRHFYVTSKDWSVGQITEPLDYPGEPIPWEPASNGLRVLMGRIREAVDRFAPDFVILTDSWTMKPRLAEAVKGYKFFLRLAAQECLCPLNNVRMLLGEDGAATRCPRQQLVTPGACQHCVSRLGRLQGELHQWERELSGFGTSSYDRALRWAFAEAEAVLVVNPLIEAMVSPFAKKARVVPSGFDPDRFPWPCPTSREKSPQDRKRILFAGLVQEWMKGFQVLKAAVEELGKVRKDFEVWVTDDPVGPRSEVIRAIGWQSQQDLPHIIRHSDIVVVPTIAEEALGRAAVEAMACGRPVVASRIGGLPWTVPDGGTGLLFEPGDSHDLAQKLARLLDDPALCERLGTNGRKRFEEEYTWQRILERHYRPLLGEPTRLASVPEEVAG